MKTEPLYMPDEDARKARAAELHGERHELRASLQFTEQMLRQLGESVPDCFDLDCEDDYIRIELPAALRDSAELRHAAALVLRSAADDLMREGRVVVSDDA